jgi:beta-lactamase class A
MLLPVAGQAPVASLIKEPQALLEKKTVGKVAAIDARLDGVMGMAAVDLKSGRRFSYQGELVTTQASLIKVPVLATAFQQIEAGVLKLEQKVMVTEKDKAGGDGKLDAQLGKVGVEMTLREMLTRMIRDSDNTATNKVIGLVGMEKVNALLVGLGLKNTRLRRVMMDSAAAKRDDENTSTPEEMARLMELIYRGKVVSAGACQEMVEMMKLVKADFRGALPAGVVSASKPGAVAGVHTEAGIVYLEGRPYVLSVMCSLAAGGENPIRDVVEVVQGHFERLARSNRYGHRVSDPLH